MLQGALDSHAPTMTVNSKSERRLLKTKRAADYLSVSTWKFRSLVAKGELPVVQADASSPWLFDVRDLDDWVEKHKRNFPI